MDTLTLYKSPWPKTRLGRRNDGGYVVCVLPGTYDSLISCGISDDISFEQNFLSLHSKVPCWAFDGTVPCLPVPDSRINFVCKNVGAVNTPTMTNIHEYIGSYSNAFLKMDIEGHEFNVIPTFNENIMKKFKQIVIEIHSPGDIHLYPDYFKGLSHVNHRLMFDMLSNINKTHTLVHVHGNSACKIHSVDGINLPNVFECTYIRNDYIGEKSPNTEKVPTHLDQPNKPQTSEINLSYWPFMT